MRPLDQLIINSGALVLGVWGIRSILLGSAVPGLTAVDISLSVVILFLLVTITARTLWLLEENSDVRLLRPLMARLRQRQSAMEQAKEKEEDRESGQPPDLVPGRTAEAVPAGNGRTLSSTGD